MVVAFVYICVRQMTSARQMFLLVIRVSGIAIPESAQVTAGVHPKILPEAVMSVYRRSPAVQTDIYPLR